MYSLRDDTLGKPSHWQYQMHVFQLVFFRMGPDNL